MSRQDPNVISQWEHLFPDAAHQEISVTAREVPASDAPGEKNVSTEEDSLRFLKETQAARTMPGHFKYLEIEAPEILGIRF